VKKSLGDEAEQVDLVQPEKSTFAFLYLGRPW
jgi:hypothetical protein